MNIYVHRPNIIPNPRTSTVFDAKLPVWMTHAYFQLPGNQSNFLNLIKCDAPYYVKFRADFNFFIETGWLEFPAQRTSKAENIYIWWHHQV